MTVSGREGRGSAGLTRRVGLGVGVAAVGMLVWTAMFLSGMGAVLSMLGASVLAGVTAALAGRPVTPRDAPPATATPVPVAAADATIEAETLRRLRHDLRGILSPALMTADRLLMSTEDPLAKRAAETMVETIERAEKRLAG